MFGNRLATSFSSALRIAASSAGVHFGLIVLGAGTGAGSQILCSVAMSFSPRNGCFPVTAW